MDQRRKGMEPTSKTRKLHAKSEYQKNSKSDKDRTSPTHTVGTDRNAFLKHSFTSEGFIARRELIQKLKIENSFKKNLIHFCKFYKLEVPQVPEHGYPNNVASAFDLLKKSYKNKGGKLSLAILQSRSGIVSIATIKEMVTEYDFYFIPIAPISFMIEKKEDKDTINLLLSIFSFLLREIGVPEYTSNGFLNDSYEISRTYYENDMLDNDPDEIENAQTNLEELNYIRDEGNKIFQEMRKHIHLDEFQFRIDLLVPNTPEKQELLEVAKSILEFRTKYKLRTIGNIIPNFLEQSYEERILQPDMYIGFSWGDESSSLQYNINDYINNFMGECDAVQYPSVPQYFNRHIKNEHHDLTIQKKFFSILEKLSNVLFGYLAE